MLVKGNEESLFQVEMITSYRRSLSYVSFLCSQDYLKITNEKNRVFGKYCGHINGETVLVSGKYALIIFHSNGRIENKGFLISFTPCKILILSGVYTLIIVIITLSNGNRTEWRPIRSVIIRVITKSDDRAAGVRSVYYECD